MPSYHCFSSQKQKNKFGLKVTKWVTYLVTSTYTTPTGTSDTNKTLIIYSKCDRNISNNLAVIG